MTAAEIAYRLHGRKSGADYVAQCPAHDDKNPSLSLRDADGKVLVHCHAGCDQLTVVEVLKEGGLWPENKRPESKVIVASCDFTRTKGKPLYQAQIRRAAEAPDK